MGPQTFRFRVWALESITCNGNSTDVHLIDLQVLTRRLTDNEYRDLLENDLSGLLYDVPLAIRERILFMYDGAAPHFNPCHEVSWTTFTVTDPLRRKLYHLISTNFPVDFTCGDTLKPCYSQPINYLNVFDNQWYDVSKHVLKSEGDISAPLANTSQSCELLLSFQGLPRKASFCRPCSYELYI
jgi:hypothetical protein